MALTDTALVDHLTQKSPTWLRRQLIEPDPVFLHDWHKIAEQFQSAVREALSKQSLPS